eukprot:681657-Pelagomonas_calceolata.AAC.5
MAASCSWMVGVPFGMASSVGFVIAGSAEMGESREGVAAALAAASAAFAVTSPARDPVEIEMLGTDS